MEGTENNILDYKQDKHSPYEGLLYHIYFEFECANRKEKHSLTLVFLYCQKFPISSVDRVKCL